ncbi:MAG: hypothetical protein AAF125_11255 [Chloroflexota bacterium]
MSLVLAGRLARRWGVAWLLSIVIGVGVGRLIDSEQIAYESRVTRENYEIMLLDVRLTIPVPLTNTPHGERQPSWSPDGTQIAFSSDVTGAWEIYTLDLSTPGATPQQLTADGARAMHPAWTPTGGVIAYDSSDSGRLQLYLRPAMGGTPEQITITSGEDASWSPDGTRLAYESYQDSDLEVYVLDVETGAQQNITDNMMFNEWSAAWSPDGAQLAFSSTRNSEWQVYIADLVADAETRQLTALPRDTAGAAWSLDGRWLIVEMYEVSGTRSLYRVPSDGERVTLRAARRLTTSPTDDRFAAWRPEPMGR